MKNFASIAIGLLLTFLLANSLNARPNELPLNNSPIGNSSNIIDEWIVKTELLSPFSPFQRYLKFGAEKKLNRRLGIQSEFGIKFDKFKVLDFDIQDDNHSRLLWSSDIRRYFRTNQRKRNYPWYIGSELAFGFEKFDRTNDWLKTKSGTNIFYDKANIKKRTIQLGFKVGRVIGISDRIRLEIYTAVGAKQNTITHLELTNPAYSTNSNPVQFSDIISVRSFLSPNDYQKSRQEGNYIQGYVNFGVKLGYVFQQVSYR